MGKRKITGTIALTAVMGVCFTAGVYAKDTVQKVQAYLRPDFKVQADGSEVQLAKPPLIYDGSGYLPVRTLGELLGAKIDWDEKNSTILITTHKPDGAAGQTGGDTVPPAPVTEAPPEPEKEIKLTVLARYELVYNGSSYPVLAASYKNGIYLRKSDLAKMPFSLTGIKESAEKLTEESYILIDLVKNKWQDQVRVNLLQEAVTDGALTAGQKKAIYDYFGSQSTVYLIKALSGTEVMAVIQNNERRVMRYTMKLYQTSSDKDSWGINGISHSGYTD